MPLYFQYSRWDGSQQVFDLDEDQLLDQLSKDVMEHGDLSRALRDLFRQGLRTSPDERTMGLRDLMERLRQQRQQNLQRYNLDSVMDDLHQQLQEIVEQERQGIEHRLEEANQQLQEASAGEKDQMQGLMEMLEQRAQRNQEALDNLPQSVGGQIQQLSEYDFMDPEAQQKFQELLNTLKQQMMENYFQGMQQALQQMTPEQMEALRQMLRDLNQMLRDRTEGREPDFQGFMDKYGGMFGENPPSSLEELLEQLQQRMAQAQSLMESLSPEQRKELQETLDSLLDDETMDELAQLAQLMGYLMPPDELSQRYPFTGEEDMTLEQAMEAMGELQSMDDLEQRIQQVMRQGNIQDLDPHQVEELLGEEARRDLEQLQRITRLLEEAGYLRRTGNKMELTPRGIRRLAQKALQEVFSQLKKDRIGSHYISQTGFGGDPSGDTKLYEFGDPFQLDLQRTVKNAVIRGGPRVPVKLGIEDFEVLRTEHLTQTATVLLLDQSRSMGMFGNFASAKRVALALHALIQSQYSRDKLFIIGFSDYAVQLKTEELPEATWNSWVSGTNMHHAFALSRQLLAKERVGTKQILMITDGEPTTHLEGTQAYFSYPPSYRTIEETLKEVKRCTQAGIIINTFMLETSSYLLDFVDKMTRLNKGRAFYSSADQLGKYVLVDYVKNRRQRIT